MKYLITLLLFIRVSAGYCQLTIMPGGSLYLKDSASLTLDNISFMNNGFFSAGSSTVTFKGVGNDSISGSSEIGFHRLYIAKNGEVRLKSPISVTNAIAFHSGHLFIGNNDVQLGRTGILEGETETHRLFTTGSGEVIAARTINGGMGVNPGNLGLTISTGANLGDIIIRRGHLAQSGTGLTSSIKRYYEISTQFTPADLTASLVLNYFDVELNGFSEESLEVYRSPDAINWTNLGATSQDTTLEQITINGIQSFSRFTLGGTGIALAVQFLNVSGRCDDSKVLINWQTAHEQNSLQFDVQRLDGGTWVTLGSVPSSGNSNTLRSYSYVDNNPGSAGLYRIVEKSTDGRLQYSAILRISCSGAESFRLWPNPATSEITLQINSSRNDQIKMRIYDVRGALVKEKITTVQRGVNSLQINLTAMAAGFYSLAITGDEGQRLYSTTFIKQ